MNNQLIAGGLRIELQAWKTEATFNLTMESLKWAHAFGAIVRDYHKGELNAQVVESLTHEIGKSRATIFRWVELFDKFPNLEKELENHGKDISMSKLLGTPKKEDCPHTESEEIARCKKCHKVMAS